MKKKLAIGGGIIGGLIVIVIIAVAVLVSNLDSIIKAGVEKFGPEMTGATVTLEAVEISARSGEGRLAGLTVGNPAGFKTESAFRLGEISIKIDVKSIAGDTIVIREIVIKAPEITYELGNGSNNLDTLKRNVEAFIAAKTGKSSAGDGAGGGDNAGNSASKAGGGKNLIIESLVIEDGRVNVSAVFLGGRSLGVTLPAIRLKDLGKKEGGVPAGEIAAEILARINANVKEAVTPDIEKITGKIKDSIGQVKELLSKSAPGGGSAIAKGAAEIGEKLKGLLGKQGLFGK